MKIAITGKGGVGKTTICSLLARQAVKEDFDIWAINADPDANLSAHFGVKEEILPPLSEWQKIITDRVGQDGLINLTPKVSDIPDRFSVEKDGVTLLSVGPITRGGSGCTCAQNTFLRSLIQHLCLQTGELVFFDMEAGIEHLGRATIDHVDGIVIVVTPDEQSLLTRERIINLSRDIGVEQIFTVSNKIRDERDLDTVKKAVNPSPIGNLPYHETIRIAGREGKPPKLDGELGHNISTILNTLLQEVKTSS